MTDTLCWSNPCQNGGTCITHGDAYTCSCPADVVGVNCQKSKLRDEQEIFYFHQFIIHYSVSKLLV